MKLYNLSIKRPDSSYPLLADKIPLPPPNWLRFLPNGMPYPNVVVEVAVNNESPRLFARRRGSVLLCIYLYNRLDWRQSLGKGKEILGGLG